MSAAPTFCGLARMLGQPAFLPLRQALSSGRIDLGPLTNPDTLESEGIYLAGVIVACMHCCGDHATTSRIQVGGEARCFNPVSFGAAHDFLARYQRIFEASGGASSKSSSIQLTDDLHVAQLRQFLSLRQRRPTLCDSLACT